MATTEGTKTPLSAVLLENQLDIASVALPLDTPTGCAVASFAHVMWARSLGRPTELLRLYCISRC
jgi:hypothetical protein